MSISKRQQQKQTTKNHILHTAMSCFSQNGIMATTTAEIAKAAGVSHGTIFAHFPTQQDLLNSVVENFGYRINQRLHELVEDKSTLEEVIHSHLAVLCEFEPFYTRLITERRILPKSVSDTYIIINSTVSFHIATSAQNEINLGKIKNLPIHLLYNTWIGLIHYYLLNNDLFSNNQSVLKKHSNELITHFLNLINLKEDYL